MLLSALSETVVKGTLNNPSELNRNTATTGLLKSFNHMNEPVSRFNVAAHPVSVLVTCRNSEKL